jgi:uncharacterized protein (TIGR02300 family)
LAKPEWGTKRICANCGTRYYDLRRDPPTCPVCGSIFDPEALLRSRRARPTTAEEIKKVAAAPLRPSPSVIDEADELGPEIEGVSDEVPLEDLETEEQETVEDEEVLIEDASELGEDDDMGDVVDMESDDEESR